MTTVNFTVEPFSCPSCVKKIENVVGKEPGVETVKVLFNSNKVRVTFDESLNQTQALADTITKLGYPVTTIKA